MAGCRWPLDKVEALVKDDAEVLAMWRDAVTPPDGVHHGHDNIITRQGTSRSCTLSRSKRDHPEIFARVVAGELSANAAAIEAGFRKWCPARSRGVLVE